eukprot:TRINITY_DN2849_c0_g7_i2.p3 TRINITY_DN2849_c0_g7~~TRINITY_DN2849_c0_g7_i2.p3  ORF type:complete len:245 (+),score=60.95 TRINITY_DN2849_c0_g7_i2:2301-3035(+)
MKEEFIKKYTEKWKKFLEGTINSEKIIRMEKKKNSGFYDSEEQSSPERLSTTPKTALPAPKSPLSTPKSSPLTPKPVLPAQKTPSPTPKPPLLISKPVSPTPKPTSPAPKSPIPTPEPPPTEPKDNIEQSFSSDSNSTSEEEVNFIFEPGKKHQPEDIPEGTSYRPMASISNEDTEEESSEFFSMDSTSISEMESDSETLTPESEIFNSDFLNPIHWRKAYPFSIINPGPYSHQYIQGIWKNKS